MSDISMIKEWPRNLATAFIRGLCAAELGKRRDQCPYKDKRTQRGSVTFSRAYRNAWFQGWDYHQEQKKGAPA